MSQSVIRKFAQDVLNAGFGPWFLIGLIALVAILAALRLAGAL